MNVVEDGILYFLMGMFVAGGMVIAVRYIVGIPGAHGDLGDLLATGVLFFAVGILFMLVLFTKPKEVAA